MSQVQFTDSATEGGILGGVVSWTPPADTSVVTNYAVYIANDELNTYGAQLWDLVLESPDVPAGTNQMTIWPGTSRRTVDTGYPANWLLIFTSANQLAADAAKVRLYDESGTVPNEPGVSGITFEDTDATLETVGGTVEWVLPATADLGFTTHFSLYLADDADGTNEKLLETVALGTNQVVLAAGTDSATRTHLLLYGVNSHGRSATAASLWFQNISTDMITSTTTLDPSTSTVTTTTTTVLGTVSDLTYVDTDETTRHLGGYVTWTPPSITSNIKDYLAYIATDDQNTWGALLVEYNSGLEHIAVGTNRLHVYRDTVRQLCCGRQEPAHWLLLFTRDVNDILQPVADAVIRDLTVNF